MSRNEDITRNDIVVAMARGKTGHTVVSKVTADPAQVCNTLTPNGVGLGWRSLGSQIGWGNFESWDLNEIVRRYNEMG